MSRFDVSSFIQALLLSATQVRNNRLNNVGVSGPQSGNSLQDNRFFNNFMAGFGRTRGDVTQVSRSNNFGLDVLPQGDVTTRQFLQDAGSRGNNTDITLGSGLFGAPPTGRKTTSQVAFNSGDNLDAKVGLEQANTLQMNGNSDPTKANTTSNVAASTGNSVANTAQRLVNGQNNLVVLDNNLLQSSVQSSKNVEDTTTLATGGINSLQQEVEGDPAGKKANNATLILDQTLDAQTLQVARNGAGDLMMADSNGQGSLAALQASNNSKGQVAGVDNRFGEMVFTAQSTKDSVGEQAAVMGNSVATKGLGAAQDNTGSGNSVIELTGNLAPEILGAQINNVSTTDKTPNSLALAAVNNLTVNPSDGSAGNLLLVQDNKTTAQDMLIVAKDNGANTSIAQNTTGDVKGTLGTVVDGNLGATTVKQLIVGQDGKPITANSENLVTNNLIGNTVQGSARQEAKGTTTLSNTGTLDGVSVFNAAKNTDGSTTITVKDANNLSGTPSFATSTVDGKTLSAVGDVAIASQRINDKGTTTINLTNNMGNQTVNANDLNSGSQTVKVDKAIGGIVTLADGSASDVGSTATRNTSVNNVLGQVTASTSSTNQGDVNQSVSNVVSMGSTTPVAAQAGNLAASGNTVALVADRALGKGNVTQTGTLIAGDVGAAARQTKADGGTNQTFNKVDGNVTTFGSVDQSSGGVKTTVADVSGQVNITGQATNSGGGVTVDAQRAQAINVNTLAANGGPTTVKANDADTITVQAAAGNGPVNTTVERTNVATVVTGSVGNTIGNNSSTLNNVGTANVGLVAVDTGTAANDSSATLKVTNADTANILAMTATDKNQVDVKAGTVNGTIGLAGSGADTVKIDGTGGGKDTINVDTRAKTGTTTTQAVLSDGSVINFRGGTDFATVVDVKADAAGGKVQANLEFGGLYSIKMNDGTVITGVTKEQMDKLTAPTTSSPAPTPAPAPTGAPYTPPSTTPSQGVAVGEPNPATPKTPTGTVTTNNTVTTSTTPGSTVDTKSTSTVNGTPVGNSSSTTTATAVATPVTDTKVASDGHVGHDHSVSTSTATNPEVKTTTTSTATSTNPDAKITNESSTTTAKVGDARPNTTVAVGDGRPKSTATSDNV
jgi:hypothetical protein